MAKVRERKVRHKEIEPWMVEVVEQAINQGMPVSTIAGLISVSPTRFRQWYVDGQEDDCPNPLKIDLAVTIDRSRAKAVQDGVMLMRQHAAMDWKAAHELLKVSDPETWVTASKVKVDQVVKVERDLSALSVEELEQLAALEDRITRGLPSGDDEA